MTNKRFISVFITMFLLFIAVFGNAGCGGGGSSPSNNRESTPEPTPVVYYTVTFDSQGGSSVPSQRVKSGDTVIKPGDPIRDGYSFAGWYKSANGTTQFNFGSGGEKVTGDITLYAKWNEDQTPGTYYTVIFDSNGGSSVPSQRVMAGGTVTRPADPVKEGCTFNGWFLANKQFKFGNDGDKVTENITLYAKWIETTPAPSGYTVTFNSNGGSAVESIHASSDGTVNMPENPTKEGYVFAGWFKDEAFTEIFTFGADGDKITKDTTLYAQWINTDTLRAEYALGEIVIGYADGDNPKYVTSNLTLPTKIDDISISWSSSNAGVVSLNGKVTRPSGHDVDIILTATALSGSQSESRTFNVKVIRARSRVSSDIPVVDIKDIVSGDFSIRYEASSDKIADIEGNYSRITIQNADDALDAIQGIHEALGINNPYDELQTSVVTSDSSGAEYQFQQVCNGVRVYGYGIMASANSEGKGDFLHANILSSDLLAKLDRSALRLRTSSEAESAVVSHHSGSVEAVSANTELIIFALREYENNPVYAYIVSVSGTDGNGEYVDETVIINAATGAIIWKSPNINEANHSIRIKGKNESGDIVSFPLKLANGYCSMIDDTEEPTIEIYSGDYIPDKFYFTRVPTTLIRREISEELIGWDTQAVSAYTNMREILCWWRDTFGRNSLDDKGMTVKIVVHQNRWKEKSGNIKKDNACWYYDGGIMYVYDNQKYDRSCGSCIDIMTHESAHAVLSYTTGFKDWGEESPLRAISEGYADVFACIKDKNWKIGEDLFSSNSTVNCVRNIETKYVSSMSSSEAYIDSVHYVSYAAYLMYKNGLTWDELGKIWYKSMSMGYQSKILWWTVEEKVLNKSSTFDDVCRCLIWASEKLATAGELPREKLSYVYNALDEVSRPAYLSGTVTDYENTKPVADVIIDVHFFSSSYSRSNSVTTDKKGNYSRRLYNEDGKCSITVFADEYAPVTIYDVKIKASENNTQDIPLVKSGEGSLSGTIRNAFDDTLEEVRVGLKSDWNSPEEASIETSTDENGQYSFDALGSGYYTVELKKSGYKTATFNVIVSGNTTEQDWNMEEGSDEQIDDIPIDEEHFPDAIFREYVRQFDTNSDGILSEAEIANVTEIDVLGLGISSLEGVEYCNALQRLNCAGNQLTALKVSGCTSLQWLNCDNNQLTILDVSGCTVLQELDCSDNQLTVLDVSGCTTLQELDCFNNQLTALDVSKNTVLKSLGLYNNRLTVLDVSANTKLSYLNCEKNQITILDLSNCPYLYSVSLYHDDGVTIIWPTPRTSSASALTHSDSASTVLAVLPSFTPDESGTYSFTVSLDRTPPKDSSLLLLSDSEDLNASFATTDEADTVRVSADFTAGRLYTPVIVAETEPQEQSGGCNSGVLGMVLLIAVLLKKNKL